MASWLDPHARALARISTTEVFASLQLDRAPWAVQRSVWASLRVLSLRLGSALAELDEYAERAGLTAAASATLDRLHVRWSKHGLEPPRAGGLLVLANHPGAYDALALVSALGRRDVCLVAAERPFLRALPRVARSLLFVPEDDAVGRARALRQAVRHLRRGGAIVHFGAGAIEPDPAFARGEPLLRAWHEGTGLLARSAARASAAIVPCLVSGVHSARAKGLGVTRWAEARGVTTLAPLLQVAVPGLRAVHATVRFGAPIDPAVASRWRDDVVATRELRASVAALGD